MVTDPEVQVTSITPVDVSMMRDPGMRALVLLAVALGWNASHKANQPMLITARDGTQRRLPTNTSIRMSVFQAVLSTIMVHTEDREATPLLIDAITKEVKLDRDHERRLRLAIGETAQEHRQRLANDKVGQKREPEPLTQRIEVPPDAHRSEELVSLEGPHDGNSHGALMSRSPFIAHYGTSKTSTSKSVNAYVSDSSLERVWQDGFIDYECPICGRVFGSSRGAGSHRQFHYKAGDIERDDGPAWERALRGGKVISGGEAPPVRQKTKRRTKAELEAAAAAPPAVKDLVFEEPPAESITEVAMEDVAAYPIGDIDFEPEDVISQIAALVSPQLVASRDTWRDMAEAHVETIHQLQADLNEALAELDKLRADWEALRSLIGR